MELQPNDQSNERGIDVQMLVNLQAYTFTHRSIISIFTHLYFS